ncbi:unnamed protein product [Anisakis simplex]|uniref:Beta-fructofuranosidase n=1 Tax=Anisakis simplex TaxID=6269 RepID=A0A0M3KI79_ANISI|nr:unnamed protein product [Anisakis simplex]
MAARNAEMNGNVERQRGQEDVERSFLDHLRRSSGEWVGTLLLLVQAMCVLPSPREIAEYIEENWADLRRYCPPSLSKEYFGA